MDEGWFSFCFMIALTIFFLLWSLLSVSSSMMVSFVVGVGTITSFCFFVVVIILLTLVISWLFLASLSLVPIFIVPVVVVVVVVVAVRRRMLMLGIAPMITNFIAGRGSGGEGKITRRFEYEYGSFRTQYYGLGHRCGHSEWFIMILFLLDILNR